MPPTKDEDKDNKTNQHFHKNKPYSRINSETKVPATDSRLKDLPAPLHLENIERDAQMGSLSREACSSVLSNLLINQGVSPAPQEWLDLLLDDLKNGGVYQTPSEDYKKAITAMLKIIGMVVADKNQDRTPNIDALISYMTTELSRQISIMGNNLSTTIITAVSSIPKQEPTTSAGTPSPSCPNHRGREILENSQLRLKLWFLVQYCGWGTPHDWVTDDNMINLLMWLPYSVVEKAAQKVRDQKPDSTTLISWADTFLKSLSNNNRATSFGVTVPTKSPKKHLPKESYQVIMGGLKTKYNING